MIKVLILTEGGIKTGYGHITRCLALCQAFRKRGINNKFIANADESVKGLFKDEKYVLFDWLNEENKLLNYLNGSDIAIVDSYLAGQEFYRKISGLIRLPVYFDDDKRIDYPRGVVVNGAIYAEKMNYPERDGIVYMLGSRYTPLREAFWDAPDKKVKENIENIMVTLGGNDLRSLTANILRYLIDEFPHIKKMAIIAKAFQKTNSLEELDGEKVDLVRNPVVDDLKKIMVGADIAISAGGQTLYELARMGVPTIAIGVADNQEQNLKGWKKAGFIEYAGLWNDKVLLKNLRAAIEKLKDQGVRKKRSAKGMSFISGKGSFLIVDKLLEMLGGYGQAKNIRLLKVRKEDAKILWEWRNHPEIRKRCSNPNPVSWEDHKKWFLGKIKDTKAYIYMALFGKKKAGVIRFEDKGENIVVSVNLEPAYFGRGFGSVVIGLGTKRLQKEGNHNKIIIASIKPDNIASQKAFVKAGYRVVKKKKNEVICAYNPRKCQ